MTEQGGGAPPPSGFDGYFASAPSRVGPPPLVPSTPGPPPSGALPGHPSDRRRAKPWLPALVAVALVATLGVVAVRAHARRAAELGEGDGVFGRVTAHPPPREIPNPARLLPAPAAQPGSGGYTVLDERGGAPVTWDPCEPIQFVVRTAGEIPGGTVMLDQALAEVSKDTGLDFLDDGTTSESPSPQRDPYQPDRYGLNWAPVLIAWSSPAEYPGLAGDVVGLAGPIAVGGKDAHIVSGEVIFDAPELTEVEGYPNGATYVYDVILHELGHLVGLGHVDDPNAIMNPVESRALPGYGPGDLRGLAALGSGRCLTKA